MEIKHLTGVPGIPTSKLPFSAAVYCGELLFISGQASTDLEGNIVSGNFEEECRRSFDNLGLILRAAGLGFGDVVQVRNYVDDARDLEAFNKIYREYFHPPYPARTTLIGCLGGKLKFEADAVARKKAV
jgi:2-iminobutanoate/2-iminopropanoate deaminase